MNGTPGLLGRRQLPVLEGQPGCRRLGPRPGPRSGRTRAERLVPSGHSKAGKADRRISGLGCSARILGQGPPTSPGVHLPQGPPALAFLGTQGAHPMPYKSPHRKCLSGTTPQAVAFEPLCSNGGSPSLRPSPRSRVQDVGASGPTDEDGGRLWQALRGKLAESKIQGSSVGCTPHPPTSPAAK